MATQDQRRAHTRGRILAAARACFVADGYEAASLERIIAAADVSKGALYHHFVSKEALFEAVFDAVSKETVIAAGRAAHGAGSPGRGLITAAMAWLKAVEQTDARAIMLDLGPRALGWRRAKEIEEANANAVMRAAIEAAVRAGEARCANIDLAVRLLNATLTELAVLRHASSGRSPSDGEMQDAVERVVAGLLSLGSP